MIKIDKQLWCMRGREGGRGNASSNSCTRIWLFCISSSHGLWAGFCCFKEGIVGKKSVREGERVTEIERDIQRIP